jgi:hypothetical protein
MNEGVGIMLWGDNSPYFVHANICLKEIPMGKDNGIDIFI